MKNADDLFLKLRSAYNCINEEVPAGYKCSEELRDLWKLSKSRTNECISKAIKDGLLEKVSVMKNSRLTPYYGPPRRINYYGPPRKYKSTKPKR